MKKTITLLGLALSLNIFSNGLESFSADLTTAKMDEESLMAKKQFINGHIIIEKGAKTITLSASFVNIGTQCMAMDICPPTGPQTLEAVVPLLNTSVDNCGIVTYSGSIEDRLAGGIYESITVVDHSQNTCPTFATQFNLTTVYWDQKWVDRTTVEEVSIENTFNGTELTQDPWITVPMEN